MPAKVIVTLKNLALAVRGSNIRRKGALEPATTKHFALCRWNCELIYNAHYSTAVNI
jgi:hypothetical protein